MKRSAGFSLGSLILSITWLASIVLGPAFASNPVTASYLVVFKNSMELPQVAAFAQANNIDMKFTYRSLFKGFAADLNSAQLEALRRNPNVVSIELDGDVTASEVQSSATWGIDRIDQNDLPLTGNYVYGSKGTQVRAYIVDTGVLGTHQEFTGRMLPGTTSILDGRGTIDCNGHGTHVAGTVAGTTYGVAKSALIVPVRVLDCRGSGSWSGVAAGLDWVGTQYDLNKFPSVVNMSLGGGINQTVDNAVKSLVTKGVSVVVAAGNDAADACSYSPAGVREAITVAASARDDYLASYSNFGSCVDLIAPGSSITSAWRSSNTAINTISGTSMASPHVAGAVALLLETGNQSPSEIASTLKSTAKYDTITLSTNAIGALTPNLFLYTNPKFIVSFFPNDGSSALPTVVQIEPELQISLPSITRDGYTFNGWFTASVGGDKVGIGGENYTPAGSQKLYAQWTSLNSIMYTISFNPGYSGAPVVNSRTTDEQGYVTLPSISRSGYSFDGWYSSSGVFRGWANAVYMPASSETLTAYWTRVPTVSTAPQNVTAVPAPTKRSIDVSWTVPNEDGGSAISSYTARAFTSISGGSVSGFCSASAATSPLRCRISGLRSGTTYYVEVVAVNSVGISPAFSPPGNCQSTLVLSLLVDRREINGK